MCALISIAVYIYSFVVSCHLLFIIYCPSNLFLLFVLCTVLTHCFSNLLCFAFLLCCVAAVGAGYMDTDIVKDAQLHRLTKIKAKTLLKLFDSADQLIDTALPNLSTYASGRALDSMGAMEEMKSSNQDTLDGTKPLNKFRYALMGQNRPMFITWPIDEIALENLIRFKFVHKSFDVFLADLVTQLVKLRSIIYAKTEQDMRWDETTSIQPMMELFVAYMLEQWSSRQPGATHLGVAAANKPQFDIAFKEGDTSWGGQTDLYCYLEESVDNIYESRAIIELKSPFDLNNLYHSKAVGPKQQLLGQAVGCFRGKQGARYILSYLTDIFAISVLCHVKGCAYLSRRITEPKAFCLRLLMMCWDITDDEWNSLFPSERSQVSIEDDTEVSIPPVATTSLGVAPNPNVTNVRNGVQNAKGGKSKSSNCKTGGKKCGVIGDDAEEERARRFEDITNMLQWSDARHDCTLGVDMLAKHNSVGTNKVGKLSTWK